VHIALHLIPFTTKSAADLVSPDNGSAKGRIRLQRSADFVYRTIPSRPEGIAYALPVEFKSTICSGVEMGNEYAQSH